MLRKIQVAFNEDKLEAMNLSLLPRGRSIMLKQLQLVGLLSIKIEAKDSSDIFALLAAYPNTAGVKCADTGS